MIRRSIVTNLMLITLQTLSVFGLIYVMTGGGPGNRSQTTPLYMYQQAFQFCQIGYGTAMALVLLRHRRAVLAGVPATDQAGGPDDRRAVPAPSRRGRPAARSGGRG